MTVAVERDELVRLRMIERKVRALFYNDSPAEVLEVVEIIDQPDRWAIAGGTGIGGSWAPVKALRCLEELRDLVKR